MPRQLAMPRLPAVDPGRSGGCGCGSAGACAGLECLCRPRFFAGQLLTDEDLRRLDHYIVAKDRLHNRYLHGVGVVCGLEVACNPCDDTVTVRSGYAIGPCGEDIVVCHDTAVDVAALVREHRKATASRADCQPYGAKPARDCEASRQRWILAICYDERASRGVVSLRAGGAAGCGCDGGGCDDGGCAGGGSGGYGCGERRPRSAPQCEPTVTCEGYRFVLVKEATRKAVDRTGLADSPLGRRVQSCLLELASRTAKVPANPSTADLVAYCCELKADLRDVIDTANVHDCLLGARLSDIVCPDVEDEQAADKARRSILAMLQIAVDLFRSCVCSALLPPCDVDSPADCVPLATLTVRTADLRVLDICNWGARQFAVTFPMLDHWLGWLPIFDTLRDAVVRLCCPPVRAPRFRLDDNLRVRTAAAREEAAQSEGEPAAAAQPEGEPAAAEPGPTHPVAGHTTASARPPVTDLVNLYTRRATPLSGLEATLLAAMGARSTEDEPLADELELAHPLEALALTRLAGPGLAPVVPEQVTQAFARMLGADRGEPAPEDDRVARLEAAVEELRTTVRGQARTISALRKRKES